MSNKKVTKITIEYEDGDEGNIKTEKETINVSKTEDNKEEDNRVLLISDDVSVDDKTVLNG